MDILQQHDAPRALSLAILLSALDIFVWLLLESYLERVFTVFSPCKKLVFWNLNYFGSISVRPLFGDSECFFT